MKTIHLQVWKSRVSVAELITAMHKRGIYRTRPSDILNFCFEAAYSLLEAGIKPLTIEEAESLLRSVGYSKSDESVHRQDVIMKAGEQQKRMEDLENLIKEVKRGPSTVEDIKKMFEEVRENDV